MITTRPMWSVARSSEAGEQRGGVVGEGGGVAGVRVLGEVRSPATRSQFSSVLPMRSCASLFYFRHFPGVFDRESDVPRAEARACA